MPLVSLPSDLAVAPPLPPQMCKLPQDRDLVPMAREAAAKFLSAHSAGADPAAWPPELLSLVFASGRLQLDITDIPKAAG